MTAIHYRYLLSINLITSISYKIVTHVNKLFLIPHPSVANNPSSLIIPFQVDHTRRKVV